MKNLTVSKLFTSAALATTMLFAASANAAIVTYVATDAGAANAAGMVNSTAKAAQFAAALPGSTLINFESALPAGVTVTGGSNMAGNCGSPSELYGFNVSAGGNTVRCRLTNVPIVFTFSSGIDSFGLFITGLQSATFGAQSLTFSDGSNQTIATPLISSGGAFLGFTDLGKLITSVTYNPGSDAVGIDDVRFRLASAANAAKVPEPGSMLLFGAALLGLALARKRKQG